MLIFKGLNLSKTFQSVLKGVVLFLVSLSSCLFFVLFFCSLLLNWKKRRRKEKVLEREAELWDLNISKDQWCGRYWWQHSLEMWLSEICQSSTQSGYSLLYLKKLSKTCGLSPLQIDTSVLWSGLSVCCAGIKCVPGTAWAPFFRTPFLLLWLCCAALQKSPLHKGVFPARLVNGSCALPVWDVVFLGFAHCPFGFKVFASVLLDDHQVRNGCGQQRSRGSGELLCFTGDLATFLMSFSC